MPSRRFWTSQRPRSARNSPLDMWRSPRLASALSCRSGTPQGKKSIAAWHPYTTEMLPQPYACLMLPTKIVWSRPKSGSKTLGRKGRHILPLQSLPTSVTYMAKKRFLSKKVMPSDRRITWKSYNTPARRRTSG